MNASSKDGGRAGSDNPSPSPTGSSSHRTLLSSGYTTAVNGLPGRNLFAGAGDRLRELIIPDALAFALGGGGSTKKADQAGQDGGDRRSRQERLKEEMDELLAGSCVLCEAAVAKVDSPFVVEGEREEEDWAV